MEVCGGGVVKAYGLGEEGVWVPVEVVGGGGRKGRKGGTGKEVEEGRFRTREFSKLCETGFTQRSET